MKLLLRPFLLAATAGLLSACGGGGSVSVGDFDEFHEDHPFYQPRSSGRGASVTVSAASEARFNGTYAAADAWVGPVYRFGADGSEPETCRFRFGALQQAGSDLVLDGEIRYLPGSGDVRTSFVTVSGFEYRFDGGAAATLDRTNDQVTYTGAVFRSTTGTGQTLTLSGSIPLRNEARPQGC